MSNPQNILQYEFFHVGGRGVTFDNLFSECDERTLDNLQLIMHGNKPGTGIKTVIRIYDTEGKITDIANKIKGLNELLDLFSLMPRRTFIHSILINYEVDYVYKELKLLLETLSLYAIDYLNRALKESLSVAVEKDDHSFREVKKEELLDIVQSVKFSKGFWLFVFEPNNLLADKNKNVVSVM
jgi:hypothetical protein